MAPSDELPAVDILRELLTVEPLPTRHSRAAAELEYEHKCGNLPPLTSPYEGPYKVLVPNPGVQRTSSKIFPHRV